MSFEVVLRVDDQGQLQIPDHIQRQLFPGMEVVLRLDGKANGNGHAESNGIPKNDQISIDGPELVEKDGWMVIRGQLPPDFDWATFQSEDRENRLDLLTDWARL